MSNPDHMISFRYSAGRPMPDDPTGNVVELFEPASGSPAP